MEKYGVLSKKQLEKNYKRFFEKEDNITDFACDLLEKIKTNDKYVYIRNGCYGTDRAYRNQRYNIVFETANSIFTAPYKSAVVSCKICSFVPFLSTEFLPSNTLKYIKDSNEGFVEIVFGKYPQSRAINHPVLYDGRNLNNDINYVYNCNYQENGVSYIGATAIKNTEYDDAKECIFLENKIKENWYLIEPIHWIVDKYSEIMFPKKILFSNIPYSVKGNDYDFDKKNSTLYQFLRNYFIPNVLQTENIDINDIIKDDIEKYLHKKSEKLLEQTKEKCNKELIEFYSSVEKESVDILFQENETKLEKFSQTAYIETQKELTKELNKHKKEQLKMFEKTIRETTLELEKKLSIYKEKILLEEVNLEELQQQLLTFSQELTSQYDGVIKEYDEKLSKYKKEQLSKYRKSISRAEKELKDKLSAFLESTSTKEETFEYVKKQFDAIAKEEFDKIMLPLIEGQITELTKIKEELCLNLSKLVGNYYADFEKQIEKLVIKANSNIESLSTKEREVDKLLRGFDKEFLKLEEEKNRLTNEAFQELSKIERRKEELSDEITKEAIRKVVEINPVKQINVTIDGIKKNGIKGLFHQDFEAILQLVSLKLPVFLVGPAGCGKNVILKQCASVLDKKFFYQNDANEDYKLLGFIDANGIYHKTPFYDAFCEGGLLMLDEMDNANASVLLKLNSAIGSGNDFYMTFPNGETRQANKDFQVVAAANTYGTGENAVYCGRSQLDGATLDRYFVYNLDYDKTLERTLVANKEILDLFWEIRRIIKENDIKHTVSTRAILNMDRIISSGVIGKGTFTIGDAFDGTIIKGLDKEDLSIIVSRITSSDTYTKSFLQYLNQKYNVSKEAYKEKNVYHDYDDDDFVYRRKSRWDGGY